MRSGCANGMCGDYNDLFLLLALAVNVFVMVGKVYVLLCVFFFVM